VGRFRNRNMPPITSTNHAGKWVILVPLELWTFLVDSKVLDDPFHQIMQISHCGSIAQKYRTGTLDKPFVHPIPQSAQGAQQLEQKMPSELAQYPSHAQTLVTNVAPHFVQSLPTERTTLYAHPKSF